ncbi:MAG TPA: SDR family oxidoreductase [Anaerolineaceae bacterium]|jgi:3-dehydrosphinganine reductase|nr:SDR family oxidoreductase [Anaerolineaceae bacterium]NMD27771.1 SDR family oxidoreductase [Chloroflexota bacterium]HOA21423.1 SDR family oxidoreductase [Anaerolineaceae bacterium]HOG76957.1 SDR family oxidoreductase [Anaerolineaceae bacterium]
MKNLNGKLALITGGSSGIGLALACELFAQGMSVAILARGQQRLDEAVTKIEHFRRDVSQKIIPITANVADSAAIKQTIHDLVSSHGLPDLLINCAGVAKSSYAEMTPLEDFRWIMDIDFHGTVNVTQTLLPDFIGRGSGHIVNISSLAGVIGMFGYTAYSGAKFAVKGYTDVLRSEMKPYGVDVSCVFPPDTDTPQLAWENQFKPFETHMIAGSDKPFPAEKVAKSIVLGVQKNKYIIVPGLEAKLFYFLATHLGGLVYTVLDILVKNAIKKKVAVQGAQTEKHSR